MSTQIKAARKDTWQITVEIEDPHAPGSFRNFGVWDTKTGGEVDSEEKVYHPGAMAAPISLGGRTNTGAVTLTRNYRLGRDHDNVQFLIDSAGISDVRISVQPMDRFKNIYGRPIVYVGTLKTFTPPDVDSEATSDPAMMEIICTIPSPPTSN